MSANSYRVLADENVERSAARYLEKRNHDVEMVVDVLGVGVYDEEIATYAREHDRVVLTADDDFLSMDVATLFQEDDKMSAFQLAAVVDAVSDAMPQHELSQTVGVKLVDGWL